MTWGSDVEGALILFCTFAHKLVWCDETTFVDRFFLTPLCLRVALLARCDSLFRLTLKR
jgi:hypothetical protein